MQYLFFVGWLKVGESLARPFGEDDENLQLNYIIDRNVRVAFSICNGIYDQVGYKNFCSFVNKIYSSLPFSPKTVKPFNSTWPVCSPINRLTAMIQLRGFTRTEMIRSMNANGTKGELLPIWLEEFTTGRRRSCTINSEMIV